MRMQKIKLFKNKTLKGRRPASEIGRPRPAFSYYAGDVPRVDNVKNRQRRGHKHLIVTKARLVPSVVAVGVVLFSIVFNTTLTTKPLLKFAGEQSPYRTIDGYTEGVQKILGNAVWNRNKLTVNTHTTEAEILRTFPELDAVNVALPVVGRRPTVTAHVRMPSIILSTLTNAFILDASGKIVADARQLVSSQRDKLQVIEDKSGLVLRPGNQALTAQTVAFILNVQVQLMDKKLAIAQMTLPIVPNEVDVRIKDQAYYIKTDSTGDARIQVGAYLAAKESGIEPSEYMDVRVEEKVFYK